jgi:hypothetical protein
MNRRNFLRTAAAAVIMPQFSAFSQQAGGTSLSIGSVQAEAAIPEDFVGLSYESAQLANPHFFSSENKKLVHLFANSRLAWPDRHRMDSSRGARAQNDELINLMRF